MTSRAAGGGGSLESVPRRRYGVEGITEWEGGGGSNTAGTT